MLFARVENGVKLFFPNPPPPPFWPIFKKTFRSKTAHLNIFAQMRAKNPNEPNEPNESKRVTLYKLAAPRIYIFFVHICHAITDPPVTKIRLWASFGV